MNVIKSKTGFGQSILIVDDETAQRQSLMQMIALYSYKVEMVGSGEEAVDRLKNKDFDILLLDLNMPGMSGFEVINYVIKNWAETKVIVVSGDASFETARLALQKGAYDFVKKPYAPDELLNTIKNAASKKALEDDNKIIGQKLSESEYLHRFIVDHSPDIVFMLDTKGCFIFLNDTIHDCLGYTKNELLGQHYSVIVSGHSKKTAKYVFSERRSNEQNSQNIELKLKCRGKSEYRYFDTNSMSVMLDQTIENKDGQFKGTYVVARDVTEKKRDQKLINFQAHHDLLTKLPNRALMEDRLSIAITQAKRNKEHLAVMFMDLDRFKWVNDTMGTPSATDYCNR